jgi:UDP-N-acetylglucosamine:LPS N-acetylglucosamine transferase
MVVTLPGQNGHWLRREQELHLPTIDLVYFNAGGGHRSAALALEAVIREQGRPWAVRLVNLMQILDPQDVFRKTLGMEWEDLYNTRLARGWSLGLAQELKFLQALIRLAHPAMASRLRRYWRRTKPDMVVSLIPNFNRPMYDGLTGARPAAPYVTILTDFADLPPHFWIEPGQAQHFICGTPKAVAQAHAMGYGLGRVHAVSGMIVRPDFYRESRIDRRAELIKLKLDPDRPTGIVLFGGHGSKAMQGIARRLKDTQLILICGHNAALAERLEAMPSAAPRLVVGFTPKVRDFMQLSDFFIGKPGPGSISEAIQQGLPVIVVNNTWTMPQERYNAEWVAETRAGIVLDSFKDIRAGVDEVIARLPELRTRVARIENRAVFEIPEILDRLLHADRAVSAHLRVVPRGDVPRGEAQRAWGAVAPNRQTEAPIR